MMKKWAVGTSTKFLREEPVSVALEAIARYGYAAAEVAVSHVEQCGEEPRALARLARDQSLRLTVHAAYYDLNPTSSNEGIARESRRQVERSLQMAAELQAEVVVVHPGRRTASRDQVDAFWPRLLAWLYEVDALAAPLGLTVALELMEKRPKEIFMVPADAGRLMQEEWQQIALTVDIAHTNTHMDPLHFLAELKSAWIAHVHLSDNAPHCTHLPLGEGEVDIPAVLAALAALGGRYDGIVSLEGTAPGQGHKLLAQNMAYLRRHNLV